VTKIDQVCEHKSRPSLRRAKPPSPQAPVWHPIVACVVVFLIEYSLNNINLPTPQNGGLPPSKVLRARPPRSSKHISGSLDALLSNATGHYVPGLHRRLLR
jgi:hypothetical protein